jgi:hypothetical protein
MLNACQLYTLRPPFLHVSLRFLRRDPHLQGNENRQVEHHKLYKTEPEVVAKPSRFGGTGRYDLRLWAGKLCNVTVKPCQGCACLELLFASTVGMYMMHTYATLFWGSRTTFLSRQLESATWWCNAGSENLSWEVKMCSLCMRSNVLDQSPEIEMQSHVTGVVFVMSL